MPQLTHEKQWRHRQSTESFASVPFKDIFSHYLRPAPGRRCLEIGCVPGRFLAYLAKTFQYYPEGIDYVAGTAETTSKTLRCQGINDYKIYQEDFLNWTAPYKYDLVCSLGFIEHFIEDYEAATGVKLPAAAD